MMRTFINYGRLFGMLFGSLFLADCAKAALITYDYAGALSLAIGTLPAGTSFTGSVTYDSSAAGVSATYHGGTQTGFIDAVTGFTLSIGGTNLALGQGSALLNKGLNIPVPVSYPNGDSLYFIAGTGSPRPTIGGAPVNFLHLGFVNNAGTAFSSASKLPDLISLAGFDEHFLGINYGPLGTGNTDEIANLTSLRVSPVPLPGSMILFATGLLVLAGLARLKEVSAS